MVVIKIKPIIFTFILCILGFSEILSQEAINYTDKNGLKQGKWVKKYPTGNLAYEVVFKDNKPVGDFKRYHENGKLKNLLSYDNKGERASALIYDESGNVIADGFYFGDKKDSLWNYYNEKKQIIESESYKLGILSGNSIKYFLNGIKSEVIPYQKGEIDGIYRRFYEDGSKRLEIKYIKGVRNGLLYEYFQSGLPEIKGTYVNDKPEGAWEYYDEDGKIIKTIKFKDGAPENKEELDSLENIYLKKILENTGQYVDPEKLKYDPEEYIRRSKSNQQGQ